MTTDANRLIETDGFPFDFVSQVAERESWRKEIHRPVSHLHKWWATRLGSVFRGILLGCTLGEQADLTEEFYRTHSFANVTVFDPFMGSGSVGIAALRRGCRFLGNDLNPEAVECARQRLVPVDRAAATPGVSTDADAEPVQADLLSLPERQ